MGIVRRRAAWVGGGRKRLSLCGCWGELDLRNGRAAVSLGFAALLEGFEVKPVFKWCALVFGGCAGFGCKWWTLELEVQRELVVEGGLLKKQEPVYRRYYCAIKCFRLKYIFRQLKYLFILSIALVLFSVQF